jgi:hypothetical protein
MYVDVNIRNTGAKKFHLVIKLSTTLKGTSYVEVTSIKSSMRDPVSATELFVEFS